jgi:hypothetical protein
MGLYAGSIPARMLYFSQLKEDRKMQTFIMTIRVTANTIEDVSYEEVQESIADVLADYNGGTAEIESCREI